MRISLVVPCFNAEKHLRECLDSIKAQTFIDWECICVDDGSTDSTLAILNAYSSSDPRFLVVHTTNKGVSAARNSGISLATGDYVGFVDADDAISPDWLFNAVKAIGNGVVELIRFENSDRECPNTVRAERILECGFSYLVFVKRSILMSLPECFPVGMRIREDTIFLLRVLGKVSTTHQEYVKGYFYRTNTNSAVYATQKVADYKRFVDELLELSVNLNARDESMTIYKSFLWWRTQRDRDEHGADRVAMECLDRAHQEGRFLYRHAPLLWVRGFWLADAYIALRRFVNSRWLP